MIQNFISTIGELLSDSGFVNGTWQQFLMIGIACLLIYLAIVKQYEPLLLLPIAFGMLLTNIPGANLMAEPLQKYIQMVKST